MVKSTSLLNHDLLVVQQTRAGASTEFNIEDAQGALIGLISCTQKSGVRQFFGGAREFDLLEADGTRLAHLSDDRKIWRDTYTLLRADGSQLATVSKQAKLFSRRITTTLTTGEELLVESKGSFSDRELNITSNRSGNVVAQASRERVGFAEALRGHDRYVLHVPSLSPELRLAILGTVVALDMMRAKEEAAAASSN
ncbi:LURP-one-related/scramblase family protein [Arachnia rubra]|jgi:hypothetical protein|uniref:LURP-one-related family protein n=1 Tax=Arachnia rubra TaxID=1547448 RepID=A0ABX7Y5E4_9ACTN|nr:LURP-one-related family protein [Arachnia rubra]MDO4645850.1 LURP-one-related family protein [Propionibacteriaceae bacterium]QUC08089.1 LURP-one-related family protein [Arachnia rubra]BCR82455.1 hypothetical protein SK1NUM_28980 [Arachnia rubra]